MARSGQGSPASGGHAYSERRPADLVIAVRKRPSDRAQAPSRWWLGGDPVATAWHNALSASFPRGEAFFIDAVRQHRKGAPPKLAEDIRAFVQQEVNHSREHIAFNRAAVEAGYDLSQIESRVAAHLELTRGRPVIVNLAVTMALEHFTAMMASELLRDTRYLAGVSAENAALWHWHAVEEIEHKHVAYDTWLHATRNWSRWKRWKTKALTMLIATRNFVSRRFEDTLDLLAQDGLTGWRWKARLVWYTFGNPGILRRVLPAWLGYFLPGFHPWNHDDRHLIARYDRRSLIEPRSFTEPTRPKQSLA